jgi:hypothetical protein
LTKERIQKKLEKVFSNNLLPFIPKNEEIKHQRKKQGSIHKANPIELARQDSNDSRINYSQPLLNSVSVDRNHEMPNTNQTILQ